MPSRKPTDDYPKFKNVQEIEALVDDYFVWCEGTLLRDEDTGNPILTKWGTPIYLDTHVPTITGLAIHLGFKTRRDLLKYAVKKREFNEAIIKARTRVERCMEERLFDREGANGAKFALLNNFDGWDAEQKSKVDGSQTSAVKIICDIPRAPVLTTTATPEIVEAPPESQEVPADG